ncbi:DUF6090 family protein [Robiginitalea sp. IMCC43444]|uniref:DUF6090 family protein n=1 Tax=Robiginitalea sp. IMCC43444 TaxID=3459121 RepID=UPI0040431710
MLRFFRKIRQNLIINNKISKYLLYAIGEILLVVIGILIAFQIDTWNDNRQAREVELKTLRELKSDLVQTLQDIRSDSVNFRNIIRSNQAILRHMDEVLPYHDSLIPHFSQMDPFQTFSVNHTTFDNIRMNGTSIITNDSIRLGIARFYTRPINLYKELESRVLDEHCRNYFTPMIMQAFETVSPSVLIPKDYNAFVTNSDYRQVLKFNVRIAAQMINFQGFLMELLEEQIQGIDDEMQRFDPSD